MSDKIDGVVIQKLAVHSDERGYLMECVRCDDPSFKGFGQAYISAVYGDVVKAWHKHQKQTDKVVCVKGMIKLVLYSNKPEDSGPKMMELCIGERNPVSVQIPPGVWHGWMGLDSGLNLVLNVPDLPYNASNPDEIRCAPISFPPPSVLSDNPPIPYHWQRVWK